MCERGGICKESFDGVGIWGCIEGGGCSDECKRKVSIIKESDIWSVERYGVWYCRVLGC